MSDRKAASARVRRASEGGSTGLDAFLRPEWDLDRARWELLHAFADQRRLDVFTTDDAWPQADQDDFDDLAADLEAAHRDRDGTAALPDEPEP